MRCLQCCREFGPAREYFGGQTPSCKANVWPLIAKERMESTSVMCDYSVEEFYLMIDYAGENDNRSEEINAGPLSRTSQIESKCLFFQNCVDYNG